MTFVPKFFLTCLNRMSTSPIAAFGWVCTSSDKLVARVDGELRPDVVEAKLAARRVCNLVIGQFCSRSVHDHTCSIRVESTGYRRFARRTDRQVFAIDRSDDTRYFLARRLTRRARV